MRDPLPEWTWEPRYPDAIDITHPTDDDEDRPAWEQQNPSWTLKLIADKSNPRYLKGSSSGLPGSRAHKVWNPENGNHNFKVIVANIWPEYPPDGGGVSWEVDAISSWGDELHDFSAFDTKSVEEAKRFVDTLLTNYFNEVYDSVDWDA